MHFIDELIQESEKAEEQQRLELTKLKADQLLMAIEVLEGQVEDVDNLFKDEFKIIDEYRQVEQERLMKKVRWLVWNLEQYMRSTGEKTMNLPHGTLKLRLGRDKIEVADLQQFLNDPANQQFLKTIPESFQPDNQALHQYIKQTGHLPKGVNLIPADVKFHYSTIKRSNTNEPQQH